MIQLINVSKTYITKTTTSKALKNINLKINDGEIVGVVGYSGSGKSTLIRTINRLTNIDSGKVIIDGKDITYLPHVELNKLRFNMGMIFQNFNLFDQFTVKQNVLLSLKISKKYKDKVLMDKLVDDCLREVGLYELRNKYPSQLSGGQQQRVGIARAIVNNPKYLLCDEATSALDPKTSYEIIDLIKKTQNKHNFTVVFISHQIDVVKNLCNRIVVVDNGKIIEDDTPINIFTKPQRLVTKKLINNVVFDETIKLDDKNIIQIIHNNTNKDYISKFNLLLNKFPNSFNLIYTTTHHIQSKPFIFIYLNVLKEEQAIIKYAKSLFVEVNKYGTI